MNSDLFKYSQAGDPVSWIILLLELSVKQLVIQSSLAILISLGQIMGAMWEAVMLILFIAKLGIFRIEQELSNSKSNQIPFKR